MYRIYKIEIEYSRKDNRGRDYAPGFMEILYSKSALYPELIAESNKSGEITKEWEKAKRDYKYIEKLNNCYCWRGSYIELCSDEEDSLLETSYGDENFYIRDIQSPSYRKSDLKWLR